MSYVLEALRRAEAERQRGQVPGLDAQPLPAPGAGPAHGGAARSRWLGPAAAAVLLAMGAGLAWWLLQAPPVPPAVPPVAAPPLQAPAAMPAVTRAAPAAPAPAAPPKPPAPRAVAAVPPEAAASGRILRLQELPESFRRQVPALTFGGATDSPVPAARMLIINGQVFREGDEPADGLTLERITLRAAQFRWRGQRFELAY